MKRVEIYMRPGCHLCEEAETAVLAALEGQQFELRSVNIEHDDELHRRHLERIPVVLVDGDEIASLVEYRRPEFAARLRERLSA